MGYTPAVARTDRKVGYSPTGKLKDVTPEMAASGVESAFGMLEGRWKIVILFQLFARPVLRFSEQDYLREAEPPSHDATWSGPMGTSEQLNCRCRSR